MRRIEFFGPMGAGKSTLHARLVAGSSGFFKPRLVGSFQGEKRNMLLREARQNSYVHELVLRVLSRIPIVSANLMKNKVTSSAWESLESEMGSFSPLLTHVLNARHGEGVHLVHMLRRTHWFIRDVADVALLGRQGRSEIVLQDESLLQRGLGFALGHRKSVDIIEEYMAVVPLPAAVIHVTGSPDVLSRRLCSRVGARARNLAHVREACFLSGVARDILKRRGAFVIEVDGLEDPRKNLDFMVAKIREAATARCWFL